MRQTRFFLTVILITVVAFISSCSKKDDTTTPETPAPQPPSISFVSAAGCVSKDTTLPLHTFYKVRVHMISNTTSGAKLTQFTITTLYGGSSSTQNIPISTNEITYDVTDTTMKVAGSKKLSFKVTDAKSQSQEISLTITTAAASGPINTFSMKIMGAQSSSTGSSFASIDGTVYSLANAKTNYLKVDWLYFYGATNFATLASPDDADAISVFNDPTNGLATWTTRNPTKFKKVTASIDWNSITTDGTILTQTSSGVTETKINSLAANDILAFITASGKKGMIKVESINGTDAGTITISVKVQQ